MLPIASRLIFCAAEMYRSRSAGGQVADRDVVEAVTAVIGRQERGGVDVEGQQVSDGVLILGPIETT